jgi:RNA polymerase sigma-70 factor, ECF subfamily
VNGAAGLVTATAERPYAVMGFMIRQGKVVEIDLLADPERLRQLDLTFLND